VGENERERVIDGREGWIEEGSRAREIASPFKLIRTNAISPSAAFHLTDNLEASDHEITFKLN